MRFDEILKYLGEFGTYQKRVCFMLSIPYIFIAFHKLSWMFIGAVPDHRCRLFHDDVYGMPPTSTLSDFLYNTTIPWDHAHERWSRCKIYNIVNETETDKELSNVARTCDSWVYDQSQYRSTLVTEFDLVCHRNWMRALSYTLYVIGEMIGALGIGSLSDRVGRRKVIVVSLIGQGITGVLIGLVHNYYAFVFLRMCIGMFTQAIALSVYVLATEFVGPSKRVLIGALISYFFSIGFALTAAVAYFVRDWHNLQIILSAPVLLYCLCIRWIPESARWLLSVNRPKEAMDIIHKAAKVNDVVLPAISLDVDAYAHSDTPPQAGPLDLIRSGSMRKIILLLGFGWFVNSLVFYGTSLNTSNLGGNDYLNFLIAALLEFPACTLCLLLERFGRRVPACISMALAGAALLSTAFIPTHMTVTTITFAMIGKFGISYSYLIIFIYAAEVVPTQVRNACMGINSSCGRCGSMLMPFVLLMSDYWRPLPLIILGVMSILSGLLLLLLPETNQKALPEVMTDIRDTNRRKSRAAVANGNPIQTIVPEIEVDDNEMESEIKTMMNNLKLELVNHNDEIRCSK